MTQMYSPNDHQSHFYQYAMKHLGVSSYQLHDWEKTQERIYGNVSIPTVVDEKGSLVKSSLTPYILEERKMRVTQIDIFSRMMMDRILYLSGVVNDQMSTIVQAQLLFLSLDDDTDIQLYIDTPGGSVKSGLSMVDTINYIANDVSTLNTGMCASMGSILLGAGAKGKRNVLPNSRVMLHQVSTGAEGNIQDVDITVNEAKKYNTKLFKYLGEYCGKSAEEVLKDASRDRWLDAEEAVEYGIADKIVGLPK
tara:strand:- start:2211 stop:2963 length:753 start_codon:yes stop_codon:yes gene_type:complete